MLGYNAAGGTTFAGTSCTAIGYNTLSLAQTVSFNTAVGSGALASLTTGGRQTAVGAGALTAATTGFSNAVFGRDAGKNVTTGGGNIILGSENSSGTYLPVFDVTANDNRVVVGHTSVAVAYVQVAWTVTSDIRDKANIQPVAHGLGFVMQLNPISYQFKVDRDSEEVHGPVRYGFSAQDILALEGDSPVIIDAEDPDHLRLTSENLIAVLVNAIQDLKAEVDDLKQQLLG
jgi:hypothetical protein